MSAHRKPSIVFCHGIFADGIVFQQAAPTPSGGGLRGHRSPVRPRHHRGRRRGGDPHARAGERPFDPCRPFLRWQRNHRRRNRRPGRRPGLHLRARTRRRRDVSGPAGQVPGHQPSPASKSRTAASGCSRKDRVLLRRPSAEEQEVVWATHFPPAADLFSHNAPGVAWRTKPSWYISGNNDQSVPPDLHRFVAKRMGRTPTRSTAATARCCPIPTSCST